MDSPEPLRIAHLIDALDVGGAQEHVALLCAKADASRFAQIVVGLQPGAAVAEKIAARGGRVLAFGRPRPSIVRNPLACIGYFFKSARDLRALIRRERIEVLHAHLSDAEFLGAALKTLGIVKRLVLTVHTPKASPHADPNDFRNRLRRFLGAWLYKRADAVIVVSDETAEVYRREFRLDPRSLVVVENGVDAAAIRATQADRAGLAALGIEAATPFIASVGRLSPEKGHRSLVEAFAAVHQRHPDAKLLLVGDGPERPELQSLAARLGIADAVVFAGFRDRPAALVKDAAVYVQPSLVEGTSLALAEAMCQARPIVATGDTGNAKLIEHETNGLLVPSADPAALAAAVTALLDAPDKAGRLGEAACRVASERFDLPPMLEQITAVWRGEAPAPGRNNGPRVAVTGTRGIPASWGGVERQCEELYTRLAAGGLDVLVYGRSGYLGAAGGTAPDYRGVRTRLLYAPKSKHLEAITHTLLAVLDAALFERPDILHLYSQGPCLVLPLARLLLPRAKVVFTCGGVDWPRAKWGGLAGLAIRLGEYFSARLTHVRIMVSAALAEHYRTVYGVDSVVIENGTPTPQPASAPNRSILDELGLVPGRYVVAAARITPEKRIEDLIAGFTAAAIPGLKLVVVGADASGSGCLDRLKEQARRNPDVLFAGPRFGPPLFGLFSLALCFASPSELEGLPLAPLEAAAHDTPVLVSDIPPHRELFGADHPFLHPVRDVQALAEKLGALAAMNPEKRAAWAATIGVRIRERFSWDRAARKLADVYTELYAAQPLRRS